MDERNYVSDDQGEKIGLFFQKVQISYLLSVRNNVIALSESALKRYVLYADFWR